MRLVLALVLAVCGLVVAPGIARAVPGACPPICNAVPNVAWIESSSITTNDAEQLAMVVSDAGSRAMHSCLLVDPDSSTLVELALWSTLPALVEWPALPDTQVFDAMAGPLCAAYLGSCR